MQEKLLEIRKVCQNVAEQLVENLSLEDLEDYRNDAAIRRLFLTPSIGHRFSFWKWGRNNLVNKVLANFVVVQESNATFNIYQICLIFADYAILCELPICWQIQIFVVVMHGFWEY